VENEISINFRKLDNQINLKINIKKESLKRAKLKIAKKKTKIKNKKKEVGQNKKATQKQINYVYKLMNINHRDDIRLPENPSKAKVGKLISQLIKNDNIGKINKIFHKSEYNGDKLQVIEKSVKKPKTILRKKNSLLTYNR
jgi:hypothetical protein